MGEFVLAFGCAVVLLALATAIELVAPVERHSLRSRLPGFVFSLIYIAFGGLFVLAAHSTWVSLGVPAIVVVPLAGWLGDVGALALLVLVTDLLAYWHHRALHRFLWPIHAVHHSQTDLHAANSYGHLLEKVSQFLIVAIPLSMVQFDTPAVPFLVIAVRQLLEYYIHSPVSAHLGPVRLLVVDNRFHRIHHSLEPRHFDKNFGILLSVWDRIFGTAHEPSRDEWPDTGVAGHPAPQSLSSYLLFPLRFDANTAHPHRSATPEVS